MKRNGKKDSSTNGKRYVTSKICAIIEGDMIVRSLSARAVVVMALLVLYSAPVFGLPPQKQAMPRGNVWRALMCGGQATTAAAESRAQMLWQYHTTMAAFLAIAAINLNADMRTPVRGPFLHLAAAVSLLATVAYIDAYMSKRVLPAYARRFLSACTLVCYARASVFELVTAHEQGSETGLRMAVAAFMFVMALASSRNTAGNWLCTRDASANKALPLKPRQSFVPFEGAKKSIKSRVYRGEVAKRKNAQAIAKSGL